MSRKPEDSYIVIGPGSSKETFLLIKTITYSRGRITLETEKHQHAVKLILDKVQKPENCEWAYSDGSKGVGRFDTHTEKDWVVFYEVRLEGDLPEYQKNLNVVIYKNVTEHS